MKRLYPLLLAVGCFISTATAQHTHSTVASSSPVESIEAQPLWSQVLRLNEALNYLGSPLADRDSKAIQSLSHGVSDASTVRKIQEILDPYCLAIVQINPEARVSVESGNSSRVLNEDGWRTFLIKVRNDAGVTSVLEAVSPNAAPSLHASTNDPVTRKEHEITVGDLSNRFIELAMYRRRPMLPALSGLPLEYAVLQIYCKGRGKKEASIGFHIGAGTQDIGFRNMLPLLFDVRPSANIVFHVKDDDGSPATASFVISDEIERILPDTLLKNPRIDYRLTLASNEYNTQSKELRGLYPLPSRRVALTDKYPDFFFQPQVYRSESETIKLPVGTYHIKFTRGPEYLPQTMSLSVPEGQDSIHADFKLKRWVHMASLGWYSGDHHIHAAGCSHYESPEEGVKPEDMIRQVKGEDLNVGAVLTWGPGWYHQKNFFTGQTSKISTPKSIMHYDVEVSGFPSSHAGHLVLLGLKEDDYPGTQKIEEWPTWTGPVLQWARKQNALTGYAHSGWGLEPVNGTTTIPNDALPKMDGIGANEFVVTVAQGLVDVFSAGDTPSPWELNMWYHSLNCGFRPRISGETDFPCIYDERVGLARSYFKTDGPLTYEKYIDALRAGKSYVSDGRSHIIDFTVNGTEMGLGKSEVNLPKPATVTVNARVTAWLDSVQSESGKSIALRPLTESPYWHIERARRPGRQLAVELIFNGQPVDTAKITANGKWSKVSFTYVVKQSGWMALRILSSSHTNPIFVIVNQKPVQVTNSAIWCRNALDQCWRMKKANIHANERSSAQEMYERSRKIYDALAQVR